MTARLVCGKCGKLLSQSDDSVELERERIKQCPKCKHELDSNRATDTVFVEGLIT